MKANPIPYGMPYYDDHMALMQINEQKIAALLDNLEDAVSLPTHDLNNIEILYKDAQNEDVMDALGVSPIQPMLKVVEKMEKGPLMMEGMAALAHDWGVTAFLQMGTTPDEKDSSMSYMMIAPNQDASLPKEVYDQNCGYQSKVQKLCKKIKSEYITTISSMFRLAGYDAEGHAEEWANRVWDLEKQLAHVTDGMNPGEEDQDEIQLVAATQFSAQIHGFWDFDVYMRHLGKETSKLGKIAPVGMSAMRATSAILSRQEIDTIKAFMAWQVIKTYAPWLDKATRDTYNKFFLHLLMGSDKEPSAKERAQQLTESLLGMEVGMLYAEAYFTKATRIWGMDMIKNLIKAFKNSVNHAQWITTEQTRKGALMKADNFLIKLGMPDQPPDHEDLHMV
jgi:predicted metalloendopeptidase